jgi:hypothetical protein
MIIPWVTEVDTGGCESGHEDEGRWLRISDVKPRINKLADGKKRAHTPSDSYPTCSLADRDPSSLAPAAQRASRAEITNLRPEAK